MDDSFNATDIAEQLRVQTRTIRKRRYPDRKSRLDKYKFELLALHNEGCTAAELQRYLLSQRIKVHETTVTRWLRKQHDKKNEEL